MQIFTLPCFIEKKRLHWSTQWQGTLKKACVNNYDGFTYTHISGSMRINKLFQQSVPHQSLTFSKANSWQKSHFPHKTVNTYFKQWPTLYIQCKCLPVMYNLYKLCIVHTIYIKQQWNHKEWKYSLQQKLILPI